MMWLPPFHVNVMVFIGLVTPCDREPDNLLERAEALYPPAAAA